MLSKEHQDKFLDALPEDAAIADMAAMTLVMASVYDLEVDEFKALILTLATAVESGSYERLLAENQQKRRMN
jgi:hypothetical protein